MAKKEENSGSVEYTIKLNEDEDALVTWRRIRTNAEEEKRLVSVSSMLSSSWTGTNYVQPKDFHHFLKCLRIYAPDTIFAWALLAYIV